MPTLPWISVRPADAPAVVMASRFELRRLRDVPRFFLDAMRIHRQVRAADGALGVSLVAHPLQREFFTLSAWRDRAAVDAAGPSQRGGLEGNCGPPGSFQQLSTHRADSGAISRDSRRMTFHGRSFPIRPPVRLTPSESRATILRAWPEVRVAIRSRRNGRDITTTRRPRRRDDRIGSGSGPGLGGTAGCPDSARRRPHALRPIPAGA